MNLINKDKCNYTFSKDNEKALTVNPGEVVIFETYDCFTNQLTKEEDCIVSIDFDKVNPATGPLYIQGSKKNQILKVNIKSIDISNQAAATTGKDFGVLGDILETTSHKIIKIKENKAIFNNIELDLNKMIGVIGVAPEDKAINCGTPGSHGGNMDAKIIGEDTNVYLPIYHDGALLSIGDVHALMGDGEIGISGAEIAANVTVEVDIITDATINNPVVETKDAYYTIASAITVDDALKIATKDMFKLLCKKSSMKENDLVMLMSLTGDMEICQVVDPLKTVRFKICKDLLNKLGIDRFL